MFCFLGYFLAFLVFVPSEEVSVLDIGQSHPASSGRTGSVRGRGASLRNGSVRGRGASLNHLLVLDSSGRDVTRIGVLAGQNIQLVINMTHHIDTEVYKSIKPELCVVSSLPDVSSPLGEQRQLLYRGCPVPDTTNRNPFAGFTEDESDPYVHRSNLFLQSPFSDSLEFYFYCAIRTCTTANSHACHQSDCNLTNSPRQRRTVPLNRKVTVTGAIFTNATNIDNAIKTFQIRPDFNIVMTLVQIRT